MFDLEKYKAFLGKPRVDPSHFEEEAKRIAPSVKISTSNVWFQSVFPVLQELFPKGGFYALDAGCGLGQNTVPLRMLFAEVFGVDLCVWKAVEARNRYSRLCSFTRDDLASCDLSLAISAYGYDLIQTITVLQHMPTEDVAVALPKIHDALHPGGYYVGLEGRFTESDKPDAQSDNQKHMFSHPVGMLRDVFARVEVRSGGIIVCQKKG